MSNWLVDIAFLCIVVVASSIYFSDNVDYDSVKGKRVLVTGASQNIGEEIAYQYAKLGAKIVVTARREAVLQKVAAKCLELGAADAGYVVADMSDRNAYDMVIEESVKKLGGLDVLVLNHVYAKHRPWKGDADDIDFLEKSVVINYISYVRLATLARPILEKSGGQLIVVASQAGRPALPSVGAYGATKAAIINFFSSMQMEIIKHGGKHSITICYLGAIDTPSARWALSQDKVHIKGHPIADTARGIIEGGINGDRYVYLPQYLRLLPFFREICPSLFDRAVLYFVYGV